MEERIKLTDKDLMITFKPQDKAMTKLSKPSQARDYHMARNAELNSFFQPRQN
jgi:hypothetical protein